MNNLDEFDKWYDEYFLNIQGEDSPYSYNDVKMAFLKGWKLGKSLNKLKSAESGRNMNNG